MTTRDLEATCARIFPDALSPIDRPAGAASDEAKVGQALLAMTSELAGPMPRSGIDPVAELANLLRCYRLAVDAETRGLVWRADFFWRESLRVLEAMWREQVVWTGVAEHEAVRSIGATPLAGARIRDAVVRELFADTLWALRESAAKTGDSGRRRGMLLLDYVRHLVEKTTALDSARMAALSAAVRKAVWECSTERRWEKAESLAVWLVEHVGGAESKQLLAATLRQRAMAEQPEAETMAAVPARTEPAQTRTATADGGRLRSFARGLNRIATMVPSSAETFISDMRATTHAVPAKA